jgi:CDP-diacylglycerol--serine O-phosphatidyltransferase
MAFRVRERLVVADVVTLCNAGLGVVAMVAAVTEGPGLAARLVLLAAVADGLDGLTARRLGSSEAGLELDSMADVVSFGTAPAILLFAIAHDAWRPLAAEPLLYAAAVAVPTLFAVLALLRTALYTVYYGEETTRPGVQNTLAASILAVGYLAVGEALEPGTAATLALSAGAVLAVLMLAPLPYPKLLDRDALAMGTVQMGAVLFPGMLARVFPRLLLVVATAYLLLAPRFYWAE